MSLPESVWDLLSLIKSGGAWRSDVPEHLQSALDIAISQGIVGCETIIDRYEDGKPTGQSDSRLWLTDFGRGELALRRMSGEKPTKRLGTPLKEVAERLERLRQQGEEFTNQKDLASRIGCSSATVNQAIRSSEPLRIWAKRAPVPRAQSINPVVTDGTAQSREPDPTEEAAIREYIEKADPASKAWFLGLPREEQLAHLNDPDAHGLDEQPRLLGRKP